jgi:hypothetical protein
LALIYVCLLLNHLASARLGWKSPEQILTGQQPDIAKFLHFSFYEPVYYHVHSTTFPSTSNEEQGWWVGIATHVGDALTYQDPHQAAQNFFIGLLSGLHLILPNATNAFLHLGRQHPPI